MPDLSFQIEAASVVPFAASPTHRISSSTINNAVPDEAIHTIALRCQIQIEVTRRRYTPEEQERLLDLFGKPDRWSQTLRSLLWTHANRGCSRFRRDRARTSICRFPAPSTSMSRRPSISRGSPMATSRCSCSSAAPSSTRRRQPPAGRAHLVGSGSTIQAACKMWREMMDAYYPNSAWLNLRRDVFDRLYRYKMQHGIPTWEQALEQILRPTKRW